MEPSLDSPRILDYLYQWQYSIWFLGLVLKKLNSNFDKVLIIFDRKVAKFNSSWLVFSAFGED